MIKCRNIGNIDRFQKVECDHIDQISLKLSQNMEQLRIEIVSIFEYNINLKVISEIKDKYIYKLGKSFNKAEEITKHFKILGRNKYFHKWRELNSLISLLMR